MPDFRSLRSLFGAQRFDRALKHHEASADAPSIPIEGLETMSEEPPNRGLSIAEGRKALRRARDRTYDLLKIGESS